MNRSLPAVALLAALSACRGDSTGGAVQPPGTSGGLGMSDGSTPADASPALATTEPEALPDPPARETPNAPFRASAPPASTPGRFTPPTIQRFSLANGVRVLLVEQHELPIVVAQYVTRRGADDVQPAQAGLGHMTASLLEQGTTSLGAEALSDAFAAIGAQHGASMDWDAGGAYVKVLAPQVERAVELLADVVQRPAFAPEEIDRWRTRRLAEIRSERDSPRAVAGMVTARAVFGDAHPYSRPLTGLESTVQGLTRDQVVQFYRAHFVPSDSALVVAGDITLATARPLLERTFGAWRPEAAATVVRRGPVPAPPSQPARVLLVDRPRAPQSTVILAAAGANRADRDYARIQVANAILGEVFSSRINMNLREQHAYTYGARSRFAFRRGRGPFTAGGAMITRHTAAAASEVLNEIRRIRESDVTADELSTAQTALTEGFRAQFATAEGTADAVGDLFVYALPDDEFARYPQALASVTAADVRRVLAARINPAALHLIVVGDRGAVGPSLDALGRGPVTVVNHEGTPVTP